ncbi:MULTISPECIES: hypothetical protein [Mammaliicoccus]|uniref:Uncharacterized protein n=1 Tax=Mammaliicoccus sciuri TaxID=1296 RepID=A0AAW5LNC0_MAMSC|nr:MULTISPECIES: hypothetical protein [Mammaliicoccus]MCQ9304999.1 hypothetical protein [Mammaliicoccus sciuri]
MEKNTVILDLDIYNELLKKAMKYDETEEDANVLRDIIKETKKKMKNVNLDEKKYVKMYNPSRQS